MRDASRAQPEGGRPGKTDSGHPHPPDTGAPKSDGGVPDSSDPDTGAPHGDGGSGGTDASTRDAGTERHPDAATSNQDAGRDAQSPDGSVVAPLLLPDLGASVPAPGATNVPRTAWITLDFSADVNPTLASLVTVTCDGAPAPTDVSVLEKRTLVVDPRGVLPESSACVVHVPTLGGDRSVSFTVAATGAAAVVAYDRNDHAELAPFPDAFYLTEDATTRTGFRVDVRVPDVSSDVQQLITSILTPTPALDGMSPIAPVIVQLPAAIDASSFPRTAAESLSPLATMALVDVGPASSTRGKRVPFDAFIRADPDRSGKDAQILVVFPSVPLEPRGHYAFAITNRVLVDAMRPLEASPFFKAVSTGAAATADELRTARGLVPALAELELGTPPLHADDVALVLAIDVRSVDDIPRDLLAVREQVLAAPPPSFTVTSVVADTTPGSSVAAVVTGTWSPLAFTSDQTFIARDTSGVPTSVGTETLPFTLAIPKSAVTTRAPLVMYQHGQPGSAEEEVPVEARRGLPKSGFALAGFTDYANRVVIPDGNVVTLNIQSLATLLGDGDLPDYLSLLTHAEQLSFLRLLPTLGSVDVLPLGAPDGIPDLDVSAPLSYFGISQGSIHGTGLLAFAPEIHAAALAVGAGRFSGTLVHQAAEPLYRGITDVFPTLTRAEFYTGISIVQMDFDRQDPLNLARFLRREPLPLTTPANPSILMTEGLGDSFVPWYATRAGAYAFALPQISPFPEDVPFLSKISAPVSGNGDSITTLAFDQYVPVGYSLAPVSPGCTALGETEGHYCAQGAAEAVGQRVTFLASALAGVPTVTRP